MPSSKPDVGEFELDLGRYELRRRGRPVKLEKKPMDLLIFLALRPGQLVSRQDIVIELWRSDLFVDTDANVNNVIRKVRTALRDSSDNPRFLQTVVGKGYRFIGTLRVIDSGLAHSRLGERHLPGGEERPAIGALSAWKYFR